MSPATAAPEVRATLRQLHASAFKVRQVLGLIRGLDVDEARQILGLCERGAAGPVLKVLNSAIANAEHNFDIPADELFVSVAFADEGATMKRWRPRARGRATRIRKRMSHVTIVVARMDEQRLLRRERRAGAVAGGRRGLLAGRRRRAEQGQARAEGQQQPAAAPTGRAARRQGGRSGKAEGAAAVEDSGVPPVEAVEPEGASAGPSAAPPEGEE
ncbi:MAG: 50S ribosomal protein L22 [Acidimicrobiia bacterium]